MHRRRFYSSPDSIDGTNVSLSTDETHHLTRVLRLRPGDAAFVFDGCGMEYSCVFQSITEGRASLQIREQLPNEVESPVHITLGQAVTKGDKFDLVIQKATELGVGSIVPLITQNSEISLSEQRSEARLKRWRRISLEGLKQSGRRRLVQIFPPVSLANFLEKQGRNCGSLLAFSEAGGVSIAAALSRSVDRARVTALIGPEGGWSRAELLLAQERGAVEVTLGPRILRSETAGIVAVSLIQHVLGDLS